jgi:hypothetical protein
LLVVGWVIAPAVALANPKVAVAPIDGDADGKISAVVHEAAATQGTVTSAKVVAKALKDLSITDPDTSRSAKRLRKQLAVDAVIYGKLEHATPKNTLTLSVYTRGKKPERFQIQYKLSTSKSFRKHLREELANLLSPNENEKDDADDTKPEVKPAVEEVQPTRVVASGEDEPDTSVHKRAPHSEAVEVERDRVTQAAVFVDAGAGGVHRSLDYKANVGGMTPPPVGTGAFAVQLDGEIYPGAFDSTNGIGAAIGVYGSLNKALGLSIEVPFTLQSAAISETSYEVGVRYRFVLGRSSLAVGLGYWGQTFVANRSMLLTPTQLNMPDTTYAAIAPNALLRLAVSPTVAATLQADFPLMLTSGPISEPSYFGESAVTAFAVQLGVDVALGRHYGLHFNAFLDQEDLSFKSGMVKSATDRSIGGSIAFALMY